MIQLFTDSDTDMTLADCEKYGYKLISMPYIVDGKTIYPYRDFQTFDDAAFYQMLRKGVLPTTCALSPVEYQEYFEPEFQKGNDILYVHFSSAMSGTFDAMRLAQKELQEKYPERKLYTVDTKGITICANAIVKDIGDLYLKGATVEQILEWAQTEVDKHACYFFANDLKFFAKSGRVSGIAATMGSLFGVKPIIYINDNGQMVNLAKEVGKNKALNKLVNYVETLQDDIVNHRTVIGHCDAPDLANALANLLRNKFGDLPIEIVPVNPTAGSHCGPDTVGVCFHSIKR